MPRKQGSKNKSKFISVSIKEIVENFHPNALVRISSDYAVLFNKAEETTESSSAPEIEKDEVSDAKVEFVIH